MAPSIYLKEKLDNLQASINIYTLFFFFLPPTRLDFNESQRPSHISLENCVVQCFTRHILFSNYYNVTKKQKA